VKAFSPPSAHYLCRTFDLFTRPHSLWIAWKYLYGLVMFVNLRPGSFSSWILIAKWPWAPESLILLPRHCSTLRLSHLQNCEVRLRYKKHEGSDIVLQKSPCGLHTFPVCSSRFQEIYSALGCWLDVVYIQNSLLFYVWQRHKECYVCVGYAMWTISWTPARCFSVLYWLIIQKHLIKCATPSYL